MKRSVFNYLYRDQSLSINRSTLNPDKPFNVRYVFIMQLHSKYFATHGPIGMYVWSDRRSGVERSRSNSLNDS